VGNVVSASRPCATSVWKTSFPMGFHQDLPGPRTASASSATGMNKVTAVRCWVATIKPKPRSLRQELRPGGLRVSSRWPGFHQGRREHPNSQPSALAEPFRVRCWEAVESGPTGNRREIGHYLNCTPPLLRRCYERAEFPKELGRRFIMHDYIHRRLSLQHPV